MGPASSTGDESRDKEHSHIHSSALESAPNQANQSSKTDRSSTRQSICDGTYRERSEDATTLEQTVHRTGKVICVHQSCTRRCQVEVLVELGLTQGRCDDRTAVAIGERSERDEYRYLLGTGQMRSKSVIQA